jgi:hypothetical protein
MRFAADAEAKARGKGLGTKANEKAAQGEKDDADRFLAVNDWCGRSSTRGRP